MSMLLAPATLSPSKINDNDVNDCLWITWADCLVSVDNVWVFASRIAESGLSAGIGRGWALKSIGKGG
ncbi:hypothetical protein AB0392_09480 [Nonomuraea angiospora]|uniref:hypothetical protein n=1 Tax=Nonomuraea angiospora TaxID=46172 RepID=UPI0034511140